MLKISNGLHPTNAPYLAFDETFQFPIFVEETEVTSFGNAVGAINHRAFTTAYCYKTLIT